MLWQYDFLVRGKTGGWSEQAADKEQTPEDTDNTEPGQATNPDAFPEAAQYQRPMLRLEHIYSVVAKSEKQAEHCLTDTFKSAKGVDSMRLIRRTAKKQILPDDERVTKYEQIGPFVILDTPMEFTSYDQSCRGCGISATILGMAACVLALIIYIEEALWLPWLLAIPVTISGIWMIDGSRIGLKCAAASHAILITLTAFATVVFLIKEGVLALLALLITVWASINLILMLSTLMQKRS
ncbi:hypothetical protein STSP2_00128 [Anaerohalosphaera lusitana]|uniref:Uncharacterized protein n=1 Tax=Anaerohalosphaera lusitana TaxID=1936003 RepID=A0A1U9NHA9_9BACT|nr:hypothetical protein [Anaerohalosphaera lusitana]AQT66990.1 hypothetical protein STSP2_00128 [Anaerohalosphaera lusitana]